MRRQTYKFDQALIKALVKDQEEKTPSGRMSATRLLWPTQWQILHLLGVPTSPEPWQTNANKDNTMHFRHFARGKQCEDWINENLPPKKAGNFDSVEYRGWVGYYDRLDAGELFGLEEDVPHEIKSVKGDKWFRMFIDPKDGPQFDHVLQTTFYGMALGTSHCALTYIKSDTMETRTFVYDVLDHQKDVDNQIDLFDEASKLKTVPKFKAKQDYQSNPKYNRYHEYMNMTEGELKEVYDRYMGAAHPTHGLLI